MANFNQVILMGNVTRDPVLKYLPSQTPVTEFGLASSRRYKTPDGQDREDVVFVDCAAFGKQAEVLNQYLAKGKPLFVQGRLKFDSWEDKMGSKRNKLSIVVENFQFVGSRDGSGSFPGAAAEADKPRTRGDKPAEDLFEKTPKFKDSEIPF